jgi:nucleoside-diphosphate-sugar epimerase
MHRILVTGADGFLGKEVIGMLKKNNFDFVGVSRKNIGENYVFCDLSIPNDVLKLLDKTRPDVIINLAASVDFKDRDIKQFFPVNVLLPAILGNYCKQKRLFLVQSSGIIVHGFSHNLYNISTELSPDTGYGESKLLADDVIEASGCEASILRLGGIFGKNGPGHLGINKAINDAKKRKLPTIVGTGEAKRNYIYVKDAAQAIFHCTKERLKGIHYLGGEIKTISSMLSDICEVFIPGRQPEYIEGEEAKDQIIENSDYFNITPFRAALGQMK